MKKIITFLIVFQPWLRSTAQQADNKVAPVNQRFTAVEKTHFYTLEDKRIPLKKTIYGNNRDIVMIHLHDDETTSLEGAENVLEVMGGTLIAITNNGERFIRFHVNGKKFSFDPNRIFTRAGIKTVLNKQHIRHRDKALKAINGFARFCLNHIPTSTVLISLHNNGNRGYSVLSYLKGEKLQHDALAVNINKKHDADNFFLTTDKRFFRILKTAGYNVVLQHNKRAKDDGSLSIYYGKHRKRYINIEVEAGKIDEQEKMIKAVVDIIRDFM